ncbi:MAG: IS200/IS605 family transposase [Geobacteraceae bacterium]|nr:IS200/IS605 family transposase [Geobacteraceae bacterium]
MPFILLSYILFLFVTKYRRPVLTREMLDYLRVAFSEILEHWRCRLIEFGGEENHVHLLIEIHPALNISVLINNLKTASARRIRPRFEEQIRKFYWKPAFWHRAYFVGSVGNVSLDTIRKYVEQQGTKEKPRKSKPRLDPPPG